LLRDQAQAHTDPELRQIFRDYYRAHTTSTPMIRASNN
jgi:hypothetical protein